jgi:hypothetical protein
LRPFAAWQFQEGTPQSSRPSHLRLRARDVLGVVGRLLTKRRARPREQHVPGGHVGISAATHGQAISNTLRGHRDDAREVSPQWRNRQSWIAGRRPRSMSSLGRLSGRVYRMDQQQNLTHVTSPLAVSRQRGRHRNTTPLLAGLPALSGSHLRGAQPVRPVYPTSPASEDVANICRLTRKNET